MKKLSDKIINNIKKLRKSGFSYKEISRKMKRSVGSVYKYAHNVRLSKKALRRLKLRIELNQIKFKKDHKRRNITKPKGINQSLIRILGHCFFDGSVCRDGINYSNVSKELIDQFIRDTKSVFGIIPSNIIISKKKNNCYRVFFNYRELADFLFTFTKSYSTSSEECRIPQIIFHANFNEICEFLRTFWEDEGCIKSDGSICGKTKSKTIANQIVNLHKKIGIDTGLWNDFRNEAYDVSLRINDINLKKFINLIGFKHSLVCRGKYSGVKKIEAFNMIHENRKL